VDAGDVERAHAHRRQLDGVAFVAITGSCGKTTTKDLAAALLSSRLPGTSNPGSGNCGADVVRHVLTTERSHRYCIQELGAWGPGTLDAGLRLIQPRVGVVLNVRRDHYSGFRGLEHTCAEKAKVVACLPQDGLAILNADDAYVAGMRERTRARVLTFGRHHEADFHIENVCSAWPERLFFDLWFRGERHRVRTQLLGEHLAGSAVAAIALAWEFGISVEESAARIAEAPPTARRMSSHVIGSGIDVVRDDFKATSDSLGELLQFLESARAERKIVVIGQISDYPGRSRGVYTTFAHAAAKLAHLVVFVGERPEGLWGGSRRASGDFLAEFSELSSRIRVFETVRDASQFLRHELRQGDLVVLKGSGPSDHLERVVLQHHTSVQCWRAHCGLVVACDSCRLLTVAAEPGEPLQEEL
jgi:UDP-N-acetylmuramoyl-tripeptide--D-alanyl-D-alanine ligase